MGQPSHALDDFGQALQHQEREAQWEQQHGGPADQPACVARHLAAAVHAEEQRPAVMQQHRHRGHQEKDQPEQVDPDSAVARQLAVEDVHPHVFVQAQHLGSAEHHARAKQVPLNFEPGVGADVQAVADEGVACADYAGQGDSPFGEHPQTVIEPVDEAGQGKQGLQGTSGDDAKPSNLEGNP